MVIVILNFSYNGLLLRLGVTSQRHGATPRRHVCAVWGGQPRPAHAQPRPRRWRRAPSLAAPPRASRRRLMPSASRCRSAAAPPWQPSPATDSSSSQTGASECGPLAIACRALSCRGRRRLIILFCPTASGRSVSPANNVPDARCS